MAMINDRKSLRSGLDYARVLYVLGLRGFCVKEDFVRTTQKPLYVIKWCGGGVTAN